MAKQAITEEAIAAAKASVKQSGKPKFLWDGTTHGDGSLGVYVGANSVNYLYQYMVAGKTMRRIRIGTAKDMTLEQARRKIPELADLREQGIELKSDKEERIERERAERAAKNIDYLFKLYLDERSKPTRYWVEVRRLYNVDVKEAIGSKKITAVTADDVFAILRGRKVDPGTQRYLFAFLSPFFEWAVSERYIKASPMTELKRPSPAKMRKRVLTKAEIKQFWEACGKLGVFGPAYKLLLLTGQRREEVGAMTWKEIDLAQKIWTIPEERTKNGEEHIIHLSEQAFAIVLELYNDPSRDKDCEYVFTSRKSTHIKGWGNAKLQLDELLGDDFKQWVTHDLRRTFATHMRGEVGVAQDTVELLINHRSGSRTQLVRNYQQHPLLKERRAAMDSYGRYIDSVIDANSNVVPLFA